MIADQYFWNSFEIITLYGRVRNIERQINLCVLYGQQPE